MKSFKWAVSVALVFALLLAACGSDKDDESDNGNNNNASSGIDVNQLSLLRTIDAGETVRTLTWAPDASQLATYGQTNVIIWDAASGEAVRRVGRTTHPSGASGGSGIAWSPNGAQIAYATTASVTIYDVQSDQIVRELEADFYVGPDTVVWSPDGTMIASGHDVVRIWDAAQGNLLNPGNAFESELSELAWSPDGNMLAGAHGKSVKIHNLQGSMWPLNFSETSVTSLAWSPDSKRLVCGSYNENDRIVRILDLSAGWLTAPTVVELKGSAGIIRSVDWSPDGKYILGADIAMSGQVIRVWNAETGVEIRTIQGSGSISDANWSPDSKMLAISFFDGKVELWGIP